jgi:hypothetical protein
LTAFFVCDRITKQALAAAKARGVQFGNAKQAKENKRALAMVVRARLVGWIELDVLFSGVNVSARGSRSLRAR